MKKIIFIALFVLLLVSCSENKGINVLKRVNHNPHLASQPGGDFSAK